MQQAAVTASTWTTGPGPPSSAPSATQQMITVLARGMGLMARAVVLQSCLVSGPRAELRGAGMPEAHLQRFSYGGTKVEYKSFNF